MYAFELSVSQETKESPIEVKVLVQFNEGVDQFSELFGAGEAVTAFAYAKELVDMISQQSIVTFGRQR